MLSTARKKTFFCFLYIIFIIHYLFPVSSGHSCERLEQEKEDLRSAFDGVLQKVQEQHRLDLADLEERLKTFYSTEWEKVHQAYQEEADKCKAQMEQQVRKIKDFCRCCCCCCLLS